MQLFYVPDVSGNLLNLDETESKHAIRVLRLCKGDKIRLVDGKGGSYLAEIVDDNPKKCRLSIIEKSINSGKRNFYLHVAIAPTKNTDRYEWFLEKATEIGIDEITPLLTERSERRKLNIDRCEKILISAMKQSVKAFLPKINEPVSFNQFVGNVLNADKFIAWIGEKPEPHLKSLVENGKNVVVLIGPEGDFSQAEVNLSMKCGYRPVSLGNSRLRTETAGIVACHIVNLANE